MISKKHKKVLKISEIYKLFTLNKNGLNSSFKTQTFRLGKNPNFMLLRYAALPPKIKKFDQKMQ